MHPWLKCKCRLFSIFPALFNYTAAQIAVLREAENPTEMLIREASISLELTVRDLLSYLEKINRLDILGNITKWMDEAVKAEIEWS